MGGRRFFLLAFLTLSALLFLTLHARADESVPGPVRDTTRARARALLQNPEREKSIADPPSAEESDDERETAAEAPAEESERHRSPDKSVAGGGVIIGGLVTAIFAAVYCYIRVTRRRPGENLA